MLLWWAFFVFYRVASYGTIIVLGWTASCGTRPKCSE